MAKHVFDQDSSEKKLKELIILNREFKSDNTSSTKALHIASEAWHLTDWVFSEFSSIHNYSSLGNFRESLYPLCEALKIMHDLANSSKHGEVSRPKAEIREAKKQLGAFSSGFSRAFDITGLKIILENGNELFFEDEIEKVVVFWKEYFNNTLNIVI